jgi:hypothetical protein
VKHPTSDEPDTPPQAPRQPRRSPLDLEHVVPKPLADKGRAALDSIETARTTLDTARANARDLGRKLRAPGGLFGPPPPPPGVPHAPEHPLHRTQAEVAALLPRGLDLPVPQANGFIAPLGWTGNVYLVGGPTPRVLIRRLPHRPEPKGVFAAKLAAELAISTVADTFSGDSERRGVELLDPDGHVLLRSTPTWQRRPDGGRTSRTVTLSDETLVAEIVTEHRKARTRRIDPAPTLRAVPATTDVHDLDPSWNTSARVWRGPHELAATTTQDRTRTLSIDGPMTDDDALLIWAAALSWWGGAGS